MHPDREAATPPADVLVVGVDGSTPSIKALIWALRVGRLHGWSVEAVTAWPEAAAVLVHDVPGHSSAPRHEALRAQARAIERALAVVEDPAPLTSSVVNAHPVSALLERAAHARMLVVGSHGSTRPPSQRDRASVGDTLTLLAACPVVVVGDEPEQDPGPQTPTSQNPMSQNPMSQQQLPRRRRVR
jgi:nucleotide-binding universal stress UspA family protein